MPKSPWKPEILKRLSVWGQLPLAYLCNRETNLGSTSQPYVEQRPGRAIQRRIHCKHLPDFWTPVAGIQLGSTVQLIFSTTTHEIKQAYLQKTCRCRCSHHPARVCQGCPSFMSQTKPNDSANGQDRAPGDCSDTGIKKGWEEKNGGFKKLKRYEKARLEMVEKRGCKSERRV